MIHCLVLEGHDINNIILYLLYMLGSVCEPMCSIHCKTADQDKEYDNKTKKKMKKYGQKYTAQRWETFSYYKLIKKL